MLRACGKGCVYSVIVTFGVIASLSFPISIVKGIFGACATPPKHVRKKATNRGKIQFAIPSAHDLDETRLDETCPNCAGDHDESQVDEYSNGSDSSDSIGDGH